jgi:hypothetical protein
VGGYPAVISTLNSDVFEVMGPSSSCTTTQPITMNGSLLTRESNHFCALKPSGAILNV